jgi:hypothetical protein
VLPCSTIGDPLPLPIFSTREALQSSSSYLGFLGGGVKSLEYYQNTSLTFTLTFTKEEARSQVLAVTIVLLAWYNHSYVFIPSSLDVFTQYHINFLNI